MLAPVPEQLSKTIETLYRSESGRVLATLVCLLGDLDLAEEAMHEAFAAALEFWSADAVLDWLTVRRNGADRQWRENPSM
jgi:RNA polymerase sigma-70 factor, ECF subfamily